MAPLFIKGFLPQQNGSAIMLPSEITTLSGSDFDVDKMYIMLPEFEVHNVYDKNRFINDLAKYIGKSADELTEEDRKNIQYAMYNGKNSTNESQKNIYDTWQVNKYNYRSGKKIVKVQYDFNKKPQEQSKEARNNLLIDMMYGILTNPDTASKMLNPGGFDSQKKAARITAILQSTTESDLVKILNEGNVKINKTAIRNNKVVNLPIASHIFDLPLSLDSEEKKRLKAEGKPYLDLDTLAEKTKTKLDPLSPRTQVKLHQQNMTGAKLIGIYANHNANHALIQHTELAVDDQNGSFILNGKKLTSLHGIQNENKEYISRNNAGFLAASVDNVKDPVLAGLNQNTFTADASMLLSRLGYNPLEIGLLMSQPIVMEITQEYFREGRNGKGKDTIIDDVLDKYKKMAGITGDLTYDYYKANNFYIDELATNIILSKEMESTNLRNTSDFRKVEFYSKQVSVGFLFKRIMNTAEALSQVVQATRSDTQGGAAGPTIADSILKMEKVVDLLEEITTNAKFPLTNANVIFSGISGDNIEELRKEFLKSPLPFLQAFYTLGIEKTSDMMKDYFPQYGESFMNVIDDLRSYTKTGKLNVKTMNSIYNDLLAYIMTSTSAFSSTYVDSNKKIVNRRNQFINEFPARFKKLIASNEQIADLEFIKRLKWTRANDNNPVDTIVFKNVGQLSPTLRERYMRDWASLLYMGEEGQRLAIDLFRYSFYRNGFAFGPNTFVHLCPVAVRLAVPEYIDTLNSLLDSNADYTSFSEQYIYNHLDNRKLVPEVTDDSTVKFVDEKGNIKDEVTFTIDKNSSYADFRVVKERTDTDEGPIYEFMKFMGKKVKGKFVYYRLDESKNTSSPNTATYTRIEPLGFRNNFIEYEYGKSANDITTVIANNKINYDPYADTNAAFDNNDTSDYDTIPGSFDSSAYSNEALSSAFSSVYGTKPDLSQPQSNDITSITPNSSYRDANDEEICGSAPTLYSL